MVNELYKLPKDLKPKEIIHISRSGNCFTMTWRRSGKIHGCKNIPTSEALGVILCCKDEIRRRKDPLDRIEPWEAVDEEGAFSLKMYRAILESRKNG